MNQRTQHNLGIINNNYIPGEIQNKAVTAQNAGKIALLLEMEKFTRKTAVAESREANSAKC